ncbi:carbohydrate-binding module family 21 protein [Parathielavia appendiculata]|uniref:Carbohydrate-binding module family 21 protein n=1 Tax=Parathielavia appendiculata TaxID=2587402 RepID=A0AAN6TQ19_9PEZI|nr:carbohydrate-binding module family 21 protein [Parathielavia appendiculata]
MPYTPPSNRSPASTGPSSPEGSRRPSFNQPQSASPRPVLPRSASYLTRHRRTPSATPPHESPLSPEATSEDLKSMMAGSVRQSPPPITGDRRMPNGAIMSPPDSASDDDDLPAVRGRQIENLKELHDALSQIPHQRARLPSNTTKDGPDAGDLLVLPDQAGALTGGIHHSFSTSSLGDIHTGANRRFTHARSATEPHILISRSTSGSEEDSDGERREKPQMVRKKSGELVRPALRPATRRRPSSVPGTPTFSKAVHFDSHLEHVRHFLQVDRPLAVSAGSSPVDNYDSDTEYPFKGDERATARTPPFEWEITMTNFPVETPVRKAQSVRLERVWLSVDQKSLIGSVAVANFAFHKVIACRFTLDYWKTTSEVLAEYVCEIRPVDTPHSQDRFNFTIKLSDLANLESKTLFFCVRYNVNGQEYWDNNNGTNFQVDFRKKMLPQNGKKGVIGAASRPLHGLPKSNRRPGQKTKPAAPAPDEFGDNQKVNFSKSIHDYLGESVPTGLRLKGVKSAGDLPSDNLSNGLSGPSGQFSLRYDFGNSLSKAIQNAKNEMAGKPDGLYMKSRKKAENPALAKTDSMTGQVSPVKVDSAVTKPSTGSPTANSPNAGISSASYHEIVNKWCFYGSKPKSAQLKQAPTRGGRFEGSDDSASSTASYEGSPVQMSNYYYSHSGTQYHSLLPPDHNPYFPRVPILRAMGESPAETPLERTGSSTSNPTPARVDVQPAQPHTDARDFASLAGTSPDAYLYQHTPDRFPFSGPETYSSAPIRG